MTNNYLENLLGENEHIIFVTRQHWLILFAKILTKIVLAVGLIVLITGIWLIWWPQSLMIPLAYLLLILPIVGLVQNVIVWTSQQYIVTDWRVIQLSGVFSKEATDSSLEKVNDVKLDQSFWGRIMDYGDIEILTASELGINRFMQIAQPIQLKTAMLNAKEELEHGHQAEAKPSRPEADIAGPIEQLDDLRQQGLLTETEFQEQKTQILAKL